MSRADTLVSDSSGSSTNEGLRLGADSRFRLIVVAALRAKQLLHGARPKIEADPKRRRHTSIALEEVRQGLIPFKLTNENGEHNGLS